MDTVPVGKKSACTEDLRCRILTQELEPGADLDEVANWEVFSWLCYAPFKPSWRGEGRSTQGACMPFRKVTKGRLSAFRRDRFLRGPRLRTQAIAG